jgi:16S rRNA (adenine1518-N6/adenine1519-N6)-dimethyltransferase
MNPWFRNLGFKPKKSLGQSFLISDKIADKLVDALELRSTDNVLEIGAGLGILTTRLGEKAHKVFAVEIDERLIPILQENTKNFNNIEIIHQDILKLDWQKCGLATASHNSKAKIIGNIPYFISSEIIEKLLQNINIWDLVVLTTQREFTNKLLASRGNPDYCALTVLFEYYTERKKLLSIPASSFRPSPKIVSTALIIKKRSYPLFRDIDFRIFRRVVSGAFKYPRKTILNNLVLDFNLKKDEITQIASRAGVDLNLRAQGFSVNEFYQLSKQFSKLI